MSELEHSSARPLSTLLFVVCALYVLHLSSQVWWALEPEVSSRGLTRDYPPPQTLEGGAVLLDPLLDPLTRPLPAELKRRYQLSGALEAELSELIKRWGPHLSPQARLVELKALLTSHKLTVHQALLQPESPLPLLIAPPEPSAIAQALAQPSNPKPPPALALLIARYAGVWVWFEPSVGVVLDELPAEWRDLEALSIKEWREVRW